MKKALYVATVDIHIKSFHLPYLKLLHDNGYEVHVATNGDEKFPFCDIKHQICIERSPFKLSNLKAIKQLRKIIEKEKFDIVHCHTPMGAVVARLASKKARKIYGTRVIYTAHGFHFYKGAPKLNWLLFYPIEKYLAKYTDTLITINNEDYCLAQKKFSKRCKDIQYVPGVGIDIKKFDIKLSKKDQKDFKESLGLKESDYVLTCVARLDRNKNQLFLINVVEELVRYNNSIHLLLVGPDELNGYYQKIVDSKKLSNNIHFLGRRNDIPELLSISNIIVSASLREGLPVNIIEAIATGKPVVAYKCRGVIDLIEQGKNGYIVDNIQEMVQYIKRLSKSNDLTEKIINFNRKKSEKFSIEHVSKMINDIYFVKKRVLHVLSTNSFSGAEKVACDIISNIEDTYDCYYCSPNGNIANYLIEKNISFCPIKSLNRSEIKKILEEKKINIIHAHDYRASFVCSTIKKNRKLIIHLHNNNPWLKRICLKSFIFLFSSMLANKILIVSKSIEEEFIFSKLIRKKMNCIGNPVSRDNVLSFLEKNKYDKEYDLCCVARLSIQKNPFRFLKVVELIKKEIPSVKVVWVGDGELLKEITSKSKEMGLSNNVKFVGFKKNPYEYMKKSKVFLLTSDWEGYGLVAFESLSLGTPCVVSKVGGLVNIVNSSCGKTCDINNVEEYVKECLKLLNDENYYKSKSEGAVIRSKELDNSNTYYNIIKKIYNE